MFSVFFSMVFVLFHCLSMVFIFFCPIASDVLWLWNVFSYGCLRGSLGPNMEI